MRYAVLMRFAVAAALLLSGAICATPARADALDNIRKAGVLKAGIFEDFPPFSSAGADMSLQGYDVDVGKRLAHALGVKLNSSGHRAEPHPDVDRAQGRPAAERRL